MIHRRFESDATRSEALYSDCDRYRYGLSRIWDEERPPVLFIMLNPSTATERANDPTIHRCETRARGMGAGGVLIANLYGWRATRPAELRRARDPVGDANDGVIRAYHARAGLTVAAWGVHGGRDGRGRDLARRLGALHHLGLTKHGHPRHPLYVPYAVEPQPWPAADRYAGR
jgi:hypothetical protein